MPRSRLARARRVGSYRRWRTLWRADASRRARPALDRPPVEPGARASAALGRRTRAARAVRVGRRAERAASWRRRSPTGRLDRPRCPAAACGDRRADRRASAGPPARRSARRRPGGARASARSRPAPLSSSRSRARVIATYRIRSSSCGFAPPALLAQLARSRARALPSAPSRRTRRRPMRSPSTSRSGMRVLGGAPEVGDAHDRELETLGGVDAHQPDGVGLARRRRARRARPRARVASGARRGRGSRAGRVPRWPRSAARGAAACARWPAAARRQSQAEHVLAIAARPAPRARSARRSCACGADARSLRERAQKPRERGALVAGRWRRAEASSPAAQRGLPHAPPRSRARRARAAPGRRARARPAARRAWRRAPARRAGWRARAGRRAGRRPAGAPRRRRRRPACAGPACCSARS